MTGVLKCFRFEPRIYEAFKEVAHKNHIELTTALEEYMQDCLDAQEIIHAEKSNPGLEAEARVLMDWVAKGRIFYRNPDGQETHTQSRLLHLLPRIRDAKLRAEVQVALQNACQNKPR